MRNNLRVFHLRQYVTMIMLLVSFLILSALTTWAWNPCPSCNPACNSCQTCNCGTCVDKCSSSQCKTCVNGNCQSTCNSCQTCINGSCQPKCSSSQCQTCVNGNCQSTCNSCQTCVNGECKPKPEITYTYDEVGNRRTMTSITEDCGSETTYYTYDYLNRLTSVTNPDLKTISYQYDPNGNRIQMTHLRQGYGGQSTTTYTYTDNNQLESVYNSSGTTSYSYDELGNQTLVTYPNGTYTEYTYHPTRNWVTAVVNKNSGGTVISSFDYYTYDNVGNRLSVTELDGSQVAYTYDDIYQLESETRTGTNAYTISYTYDAVGNRLTMTKNSIITDYTYNDNNQLLTETIDSDTTITYDYDNNGNLITKTDGADTTLYEWDWRNMLVQVSSSQSPVTSYEYNGDGNRIAKTTDGVKTKYINDIGLPLVQVLFETDDADTVLATYTYGNDLIAMNREGTISYYHYDGLGSTRQLTNDTEAVVASYTYDAFGTLIASSGTAENNYLFTGEQFDSSSGLLFLRERYYDPVIGRFISRDPIGYLGGLNLYAYVGNNPVNRRDPSGKICISWYGNFCGPGWSGGECSKPGGTNWNVEPIDALDACCKEHDKGYQGYDPETNACEKVTPKDRKDADKKLCDCLNKVDPSELVVSGGAGKIDGMKRLFGCNK